MSVQQHLMSSDLNQKSFSLNFQYYLVAVFLLLLFFKSTVKNLLFFLQSKLFRDKNYKRARYDKYETLPRPSHLPIIGSGHILIGSKTFFSRILKISLEIGPVARFNIFHERFTMLNSPESAYALLSSSDIHHFTKSPFVYDAAFSKIIGSGLFNAKGEYWKSQRRLLSPAFSYRSFQNYLKVFVKCSKKLTADLEKLFNNEEKPCQINTIIHCCGLEIITESVMGLALYDDGEGLTFYQNIKRSKELFAKRVNEPWLLMEFLWNLHPVSKEHDAAVKTLNKITRKMITKRKSMKEHVQPSGKKDDDTEFLNGKLMIDEMLRANMSDEEIMYEVNNMVFAGFETTSATVHYLMLLLALNPECQQQCREEIETVLSDQMTCPNGDLTYDAMRNLKYLERCIDETLRIFPPVFTFLRQLEKPLRLSDTLIIPKGENVAVPVISLHRNPIYFPDPEKFDPDRFLPENVKARHPGSFIPFSYGGRNCIGTKFAIMAIKAMASQILLNFDVYTTDKFSDVILQPSIFLTPQQDFNFILKKRSVK